MNKGFTFIFILIFITSCRPEVHTPKPRGYFNIELPEREYQTFDKENFPYSFQHPTYSEIHANTKFFGEEPENPYWIDINFPSIGGKIYISYKDINKNRPLSVLNEDMYRMTYGAHTKKADFIEDFYLNDADRRVYCAMFNVRGDAASAYQFYATDSVKHFIRGSLYFNTTPNADSLKPLNDFLREDITHLLNTLNWNN